MDVATAARNVLLYFIVPLWVFAGLADWYCHRLSQIDLTAGAKESAIHLLMLTEGGIAALPALFFDINALLLVLIIVALIAHEATAIWDVAYAVPLRDITPTEQHIHAALEMVPVTAVGFVVVLHWSQFLSLFGIGPQHADWKIVFKHPPLPRPYLFGLIVTILLLDWIPYLEEMWRCLSASRLRISHASRKRNALASTRLELQGSKRG